MTSRDLTSKYQLSKTPKRRLDNLGAISINFVSSKDLRVPHLRLTRKGGNFARTIKDSLSIKTFILSYFFVISSNDSQVGKNLNLPLTSKSAVHRISTIQTNAQISHTTTPSQSSPRIASEDSWKPFSAVQTQKRICIHQECRALNYAESTACRTAVPHAVYGQNWRKGSREIASSAAPWAEKTRIALQLAFVSDNWISGSGKKMIKGRSRMSTNAGK